MSLRTYHRLKSTSRLAKKAKSKPCPRKPGRPVRLTGPEVCALRGRVFERDRGICQGCGRYTRWSDGQMHHRIPRGRGGEDSVANCEWRCRTCHEQLHGAPQFRRRVE